LEIALRGYRSKHGELHQTIGSVLHDIGIVHLRNQKYDEALESFQKASRNRKGSIGRDHADVAVSLVKVGITQLLLKRYDEALITLREALSIRRNALGHLHPSTARIYNNIGCVHVEFNEIREARRAFEAALDVQRNAMCYDPDSGPLQFGTATTLCNLGYLYSNRGVHEKACLVLEEAFDLQQRVVGKLHPTVLATLDTLADSYGKSGDNNNAMRCFDEIIKRLSKREINNRLSSKSSRALAVIHYKMSRFHRKQNDLQAALHELEKSLSFVDGIGAPELLDRIKKEMNEVEVALDNTDMNWL
jgi:tetratricopeptide (TPR) repeat protein